MYYRLAPSDRSEVEVYLLVEKYINANGVEKHISPKDPIQTTSKAITS